ncbi:MAG: hypothetical protein LUI07_00450, partial [Lachnospiraceae bacterium]|nr:hypothetical protein [Lachnospiraceae bacterium]
PDGFILPMFCLEFAGARSFGPILANATPALPTKREPHRRNVFWRSLTASVRLAVNGNNPFKNTLNGILTLNENKLLDLSLLWLHTFCILRMLTAGVVEIRSGYENALSKSQVNVAKQAQGSR